MSTSSNSEADWSPDDVDGSLTPAQLRAADELEELLARDLPARGVRPDSVGDGEGQGEFSVVLGRVRSACVAAPLVHGRGLAWADELQARRVAQRVLARTTREDLRRRGDMGVILGFVADRLRDSAVLRVAAALLIVQLTLVPLVAWQVWKAPHPGVFNTGIEPSAAELAKALEDLPADEVVTDLGGERLTYGLGRELERMALEESLAEVSAILGSRETQLSAGPKPTSETGVALRAMTGGATGLNELRSDSDGLVAILGAEARLDFLAAGGGWDGLPEALEEVANVGSGPDADLRPLAARTMRRAELLGVALPPRGESLLEETATIWIRGSEVWLRALGEAAIAAEPADAYIQAWFAAIVQDS